jgi:formylglycine-generating enzyme required for sulfatase activity
MSYITASSIKKSLVVMSVVLLMLSLTACDDKAAQKKKLIEKSLHDMTFVKGGTYAMGYGNTKPDTTVQTFYISKYNVSWKKYDSYTELTNQKILFKQYKDDGLFTRAPNYPVDELTWFQANAYCQYLKTKTGLPYDLPTAAQWEYVARNGGKLHWDFPTNNGKQELGKNFPSTKQQESQKGNVGQVTSALPVGSLPCTPMGICGLTGEVNAWVKNKDKDGQRLLRGQGAGGTQGMANSYYGGYVQATMQNGGFRCVINSDKPMSQLKQQAIQHLTNH